MSVVHLETTADVTGYGDTADVDREILVSDINSSAYHAAIHMAAIFDTFGLQHLIKEPTRVTLNTASFIDHIAVSNPENIPEPGVLRVAFSDHYAVYYIRKFMSSIKRNHHL